jgi:hypothetical protein
MRRSISWTTLVLIAAAPVAWGAEPNRPFGLDLTIESMQSQNFSVGIFVFLLIGIAVFTTIVLAYMRKGNDKTLRRGEKYLFAWILFGVVVAVLFGATQLLFGNLF